MTQDNPGTPSTASPATKSQNRYAKAGLVMCIAGASLIVFDLIMGPHGKPPGWVLGTTIIMNGAFLIEYGKSL